MKPINLFQTGQRLTPSLDSKHSSYLPKCKPISFTLIVTMLISSLVIVLRGVDSFAASAVVNIVRQQTSDMLLSARPITVTNNTDLILFLHFHKAGGTSIVAAAKRNQNLILPNGNGNTRIRFPTFSLYTLRMFLSYCRSHDTTFLAVENEWFGSPSGFDERLKEEYRMKLVTQLRDPFSRYFSNFLYDENGPFTRSMNIVLWHPEYHGSLVERLKEYHSRHTSFHGSHLNMFVRVLNMKWSGNVTEEDLEIAKRELDKFDLVVVMEMDDAAKLWKANHGFNIEHRKTNNKYEKIYAAERKADSDFDEKMERFRMEYEHWNRFDYALYEHAKELHRRFAAELSR